MIIIDDNVLREFRRKTRCEWCGRQAPALDPHHSWIKRGAGGGSRLDVRVNLVGLCRGFHLGGWVSCHQDAEAGRITRHDLLALVAKRERCLQGRIIDALNLLLRLPKETTRRQWSDLLFEQYGIAA